MGKKGDKAGDKGQATRLDKDEYVEQLERLQLELNDVARWLQYTGKRLVVVVEGRDTAGKGGVISAIADTLNPRQCHIVALAKPSDRERTQWYFQRYVAHLPAAESGAAPRPVEALNALALVWTLIKAWFAGLFGRRR